MNLNEIIKSVTEDTNGEIIYQEQILKIFVKLGYSKEEAERFRRAFAKKNKIEIDKIIKDVSLKIENDMVSIYQIIYSSQFAYLKSYADLYFRATKKYIEEMLSETGYIKYPVQLILINNALTNGDELKVDNWGSAEENIAYIKKSLEYHREKFSKMNIDFVEFLGEVVNNMKLSDENPRFINL